MTINLKANERLDDLQRNGYKLIQNSTVFCFGMDAVLLTAFSTIKDGENMIDLGCGNGVIPILLKGKTKGAHFTGLEIQDINVDMARCSVEYNGSVTVWTLFRETLGKPAQFSKMVLSMW